MCKAVNPFPGRQALLPFGSRVGRSALPGYTEYDMIRKCVDKPDCFAHIFNEKDFIWIEAYDQQGIYAYLGLGFFAESPKIGFVHLEVTRFSHRTLASMKRDWFEIITNLRKEGIEYLSTQQDGTLDKHKTWIKFIRHFGFTEVQQLVSATMKI